MRARHLAATCVIFFALVGAGSALLRLNGTGAEMTEAAVKLLDSLDDKQREACVMDYDSPKRVDWHFIPKADRKGVQIKNMNPAQREAANELLQAALSEIGYDKTKAIMALEGLLRELEKDREGGPVRDPERYYVTIFGNVSNDNRWGLSFEGHHLSLNFVVEDGRVVSSTPSFFGANPGIVMSKVPGTSIAKGTRVLAREEKLAFKLVNSLSEEQQTTAVIAEKAPREIRAAGEPQPPKGAPAGIEAGSLDEKQTQTLQGLIKAYARWMPKKVAQERLRAIEKAGFDKVHFAWAGAKKSGIGHYYRVQGPTFLIEFVNTQPDAAGNPANHIHCVWRDMAGDFALERS